MVIKLDERKKLRSRSRPPSLAKHFCDVNADAHLFAVANFVLLLESCRLLLFSAWYKGKDVTSPNEHRRGCLSPFLRLWARKVEIPLGLLSVMHDQCDARPIYGYLLNLCMHKHVNGLCVTLADSPVYAR